MALILNKVENHCTKVINFEKEGAVCRLTLKNGLFTIRNLDNIDHNPRPLSSYDAFHGIALSVTQHATHENCGVDRASERKFSRGHEGRYRAPKSYWALQTLWGLMSLNHFLWDGCISSFKSKG